MIQAKVLTTIALVVTLLVLLVAVVMLSVRVTNLEQGCKVRMVPQGTCASYE